MLYSLSRFLLRILFYTVFRLQVLGKEHIPARGAVVLCANHTSVMDPPIMGTPLNRKIHYMAKEELFNIPGFGWLITRLGAFPVKRGGVSRDSMRLAGKLLDEHRVLGVFPEGSRNNKDGAGKRGAASLALKSSAAVIPVAIIGNYKPFRKMLIVYGEPLDLTKYDDHSRESIKGATECIMSAIRTLVAQHQP